MTFIVLATASRTSGALTIYKQFMEYLKVFHGEHRWIVFVDSKMEQSEIPNVEYVYDDNHSWLHNIYMDNFGVGKWMRNNCVTADCIISLQNRGCVTNCRQVVYYHQPLPFYEKKWNPLKKNECTLFLYKYIYPWMVNRTLNKNTEIVVQIPFIKKGFVKCFNYPEDKVHVLFPDTEKINVDEVIPYIFKTGCYNFLYPAVGVSYKNHAILIEAMAILKKRNPQLAQKIRIHFTLTKEQAAELYQKSMNAGLDNIICFDGLIIHDRLLSMYKSATGLLFPSTIETLGLPLLEAATFGLPIIAADIDYAHEVLGDYAGAFFVAAEEVGRWAQEIEHVCNSAIHYKPISQKDSSWPEFFKIVSDTTLVHADTKPVAAAPSVCGRVTD